MKNNNSELTQSTQTQSDILRLEKILNFPFVGGSGNGKTLDKPSPSTSKRKNVIQGGLVRETTIVNGTKTATTRVQTDKEKLQNLEAILSFGYGGFE